MALQHQCFQQRAATSARSGGPMGVACRREATLIGRRSPVSALSVDQSASATATLDFGTSSVQGPRPTMEDVVRLERGLKGGFTYAAVLDGHGGALSAQWLCDELYEAVYSAVDGSLLSDDTEQPPTPAAKAGAGDGGGTPAARALLKGVRWPARAGKLLSRVFRDTDARLLSFLRGEFGDGVTGLSGATALVALVHPTRAIFASLGDCVAVVCRGGQAVKATQQHRVYGLGEDVLEELERVESTGAWVVDGRVCNVLAVSRAFGDPEFKGPGLRALLAEGARKGLWTPEFAATHAFSSDPVIVEPDVTEVRFLPEDEFLVLATDGLWDAMPPGDVVTYARRQFKAGRDAQGVADALTSIAVKRYTPDNVGVVVVDLRGGGGGGRATGSSGSGSGSSSGGGGGSSSSDSDSYGGGGGSKGKGKGKGGGGGLFGALFGGR